MPVVKTPSTPATPGPLPEPVCLPDPKPCRALQEGPASQDCSRHGDEAHSRSAATLQVHPGCKGDGAQEVPRVGPNLPEPVRLLDPKPVAQVGSAYLEQPQAKRRIPPAAGEETSPVPGALPVGPDPNDAAPLWAALRDSPP